MAQSLCPWLLGYVLASPLRRLIEDPVKVLAPWISEGMTVFEPGPGMGFFTLEMARMVGDSGKIVCVDIQPKMLQVLMKRARKSGVDGRIDARLAEDSDMKVSDLAGQVDLIFAYAVIHELPDAASFFRQAAPLLKPGGRILIAEPKSHVPESCLVDNISFAQAEGLVLDSRPDTRRYRRAVLVRPPAKV
ncbi:MAG: class I SAM-dependent methyltransferase [Candidatus Brocadiia bacterium]